MKEHGLRRGVIREWMAPAEDERQTGDYVQRIANAFCFSVTIFAPRHRAAGSVVAVHESAFGTKRT
jgi:hypothetical protein